jgi:periplasmic protein TonB
VGIVVALGMHGSIWLWARCLEGRPESVRVSLDTEVDVEVDVVRPPPPPPTAREPPAAAIAKVRPAPPASPAESSEPPPPAEAGAIVAQAPDPGAPVDLTGEDFVTGIARGHAGGMTASDGTNTVAAPAGAVDPGPAPGPRAAGSEMSDRSRSVSLEDQSWSCAWPPEADTAQIDEQTVVIRVVVDAEGNAESAEVVSDPGHGFGRAAAACAMRTHFTPARDGAGEPVRARSPLIKVRFTR